MRIGYARVSTRKQNLNSQIDLLKRVNCKRIYSEKYTGKTTHRPQFEEMIKALRKGDIVYLVRLDRFARNLREALNSLHEIKAKGVTVRVLLPFLVTLNNKNEFTIYNLLMFAQMERKAILNRTRLGKQYALKKRGRIAKGGRPDRFHDIPRIKHYKAIFDFFKTHTSTDTAQAFKISRSTVYRVNKAFKKYQANTKAKN